MNLNSFESWSCSSQSSKVYQFYFKDTFEFLLIIAVNHNVPFIFSMSAKLNLEKLSNVKLITDNDGFSFMGLIMGL